MVGSLAGIVALIFVLAWLARRFGGLHGKPSATLRLIGTQSLGSTRACVALVQVADARLLLGVTATQVTLLHRVPENEQPLATSEQFAHVLHAQQGG